MRLVESHLDHITYYYVVTDFDTLRHPLFFILLFRLG